MSTLANTGFESRKKNLKKNDSRDMDGWIWAKIDANDVAIGWMDLGGLDAYFYVMHIHDAQTYTMHIHMAICYCLFMAMR
jgi:hypothetical protein